MCVSLQDGLREGKGGIENGLRSVVVGEKQGFIRGISEHIQHTVFIVHFSFYGVCVPVCGPNT